MDTKLEKEAEERGREQKKVTIYYFFQLVLQGLPQADTAPRYRGAIIL